MERLSAKFEIKEVAEDGTFTGYASVFGSADQGKDVVHRGAFTKTLHDWAAKGAPIPVCNQHDLHDCIGSLEDAHEDSRGLFVKGKLLLGIESARDTYERMKAGVMRSMSFGFDAVKREFKDGFRHLHELKLYEVSPLLFGMHEAAQVISVKEGDPDDLKGGLFETKEDVEFAETMLVIIEATSREARLVQLMNGVVARGNE